MKNAPSFDPVPAAVTMRQVAAEAGVSVGTVSLSLRDHPSIPAATRRRIQRVARRLGYRPDALVSTLMARVHSRRSRSESPVLALVVESEKAEGLAGVPFYSRLNAGCAQRAAALGYLLETFPLASGRGSGRNLHRSLLARNIRGAILAPIFLSEGRLQLPLHGLAACALGNSIHEPAIHRISTHYGQGMVLAWAKLKERGYRRPGFIHTRAQLERIDYDLLGTFLSLQARNSEFHSVPPLILESSPEEEPEVGCAEIGRWFERHRPDVLLFPPRALLEPLQANLRLPDEAGLILLDEAPGWTQVKQQPEHIGAGAVDMVVAQIHRNESGVPPFPKTILINSSWEEGNSLPDRSSAIGRNPASLSAALPAAVYRAEERRRTK